jgi:hypothetical protein
MRILQRQNDSIASKALLRSNEDTTVSAPEE